MIWIKLLATIGVMALMIFVGKQYGVRLWRMRLLDLSDELLREIETERNNRDARDETALYRLIGAKQAVELLLNHMR